MEINDFNFNQEVEQFAGVALVDFFAPWCGPCRIMTPIIEEITRDFSANKDVKIVKVDVDNSPQIASRYGIMSIPSLMVFKNGKKVEEKIGAQSKESVIATIKRHLN